jgi:hypothetical protein
MRGSILVFPLILIACSGPSVKEGDACDRYVVPYPDLIGQQERTSLNGVYLDAMADYAAADYAAARDGLINYLSGKGADKSAYMYLACCYLELGEPYEAELQLDHLERSSTLQFDDQVEWYTVLCWLCSDQRPRALEGALAIASKKAHSYRAEALRLVEELQAD